VTRASAIEEKPQGERMVSEQRGSACSSRVCAEREDRDRMRRPVASVAYWTTEPAGAPPEVESVERTPRLGGMDGRAEVETRD